MWQSLQITLQRPHFVVRVHGHHWPRLNVSERFVHLLPEELATHHVEAQHPRAVLLAAPSRCSSCLARSGEGTVDPRAADKGRSRSGHKCYGTVGVQNAQTKTKKLKEEEEGAPSARGGGGGGKERSAPGEEEEALSAGGGGRRGVTS